MDVANKVKVELFPDDFAAGSGHTLNLQQYLLCTSTFTEEILYSAAESLRV